jgi:hypothetical protein
LPFLYGQSGEGMPQDHVDGREKRRSIIAQLALGSALGALLLSAGYSSARAGDDDVQAPSFYDKFLNTIGVKDPNDRQYEINYSERSPLVVPPTRDLPPPMGVTAAPAPNWPKDPDVLRRQAEKGKSDDDKPKIRPYDSVTESSRALRPDELGVGRAAKTSQPGVGEQSSPSDLGQQKKGFFSFDWMKKEEYATFTGEPTRANLTDPPVGYLTPSPDQPYGISGDKTPVKPKTLGERMEPQR